MKNRITGLGLVLCLGLSVIALPSLTGCSNNGGTSGSSDRTAGQYVDDKTLAAKVHSVLSDNPDYKFGDVTVTVQDGTVQLAGFVTNPDQKSKAVDIAKNVAGVKNVEDKISLKPQP